MPTETLRDVMEQVNKLFHQMEERVNMLDT